MQKIYKNWEPQIIEYFALNNFDFAKVKNCGKAAGIIGGKKTLFLQNIERKNDKGLLDDTPAPIVLKIFEDKGQLIFEQTEDTIKFFA